GPLAGALEASACRQRWQSGTPLVEAAHVLRAEDVEELVGVAMDVLARAAPSLAPALQRFAEGWDAGRVAPSALLPAPGRIGAAAVRGAGLSAAVTALPAVP